MQNTVFDPDLSFYKIHQRFLLNQKFRVVEGSLYNERIVSNNKVLAQYLSKNSTERSNLEFQTGAVLSNISIVCSL